MASQVRTVEIYKGTFADMPDSGLIRIGIKQSSLIKIHGSAFAATLQSLNDQTDITRRQLEDADESDFTDLVNEDGTTVDFGTRNYLQTLGGGNYGLRFTSGTGEIVVTETS